MNGLHFEDRPALEPSAPNRADVACFVGFVSRRSGTPVPSALGDWLDEQGWTSPPYDRPGAARDLLDVPVPVDTWDLFDGLFAWDERPLDGQSGHVGTSYLGAAVRSFFAQGGRRCYVVRAGDPWSLTDPPAPLDRLGQLVPGYPNSLTSAPVDRRSWHGVGHLFGLPDASFLCLPDLADAVRLSAEPVATEVPEEVRPEQFVECSPPAPSLPPDKGARFYSAPRC